jgi:hypothetical protein
LINFVNVDTTPSDDWSSYRIASNASLTVCFVMIGTSLAIAGSGEVVIIIAAVAVVNDIVEEAIVAAMDRFTKFRRVLTMELNSVDDDDDDNDEMSRLKELSSDDDAALIMEIVSSPSHPPSLAHPIRVEDTPPQ